MIDLLIGGLDLLQMGGAYGTLEQGQEIRIGHWYLAPFIFPDFADDSEMLINILTEETIHHAITELESVETSLAFDNLSPSYRKELCGIRGIPKYCSGFGNCFKCVRDYACACGDCKHCLGVQQ